MLRAEMMELESQSSVEIEHFKDQLRELQDSLDESKQSKEYLEQDLKSLRQQLEYAQEESYKQKTSVNSKIQEKEVEIEKLRSQVIELLYINSNIPALKITSFFIKFS